MTSYDFDNYNFHFLLWILWKICKISPDNYISALMVRSCKSIWASLALSQWLQSAFGADISRAANCQTTISAHYTMYHRLSWIISARFGHLSANRPKFILILPEVGCLDSPTTWQSVMLRRVVSTHFSRDNQPTGNTHSRNVFTRGWNNETRKPNIGNIFSWQVCFFWIISTDMAR